MKAQLRKNVRNIGMWLNHNSPKILTLLGISSGISAAVMAVRVTPKYQKEMQELHADRNVRDKKELYLEEAKVIAKNYGPSIGVGVIACASVLSAQHINTKRITGFAAAYKISESTLKEYQDKVIEKVGTKKAKEIKDEIIKDRVNNDVNTDLLNEPKDPGDYICYDYFTGKYFYSTKTKIEKACEEINNMLKEDGDFVSLDTFFDILGREEGCAAGRYMGWVYVPHTPVVFDYSKPFDNPNPDLPPIQVFDYTDMLVLSPNLKGYEDFARCRC